VTNPHDALFRFTFGRVEHAESLLRFLLPRPLVAAIAWSEFHACPTATAGQGLRLHHADLLFQAELREGHEPLVFLLEHSSAPDEALLRHLGFYVAHILTEWERTQTTVPYVVPVVVHHGAQKFSVACADPPDAASGPEVVASLMSFQPGLDLLIDDPGASHRSRDLGSTAERDGTSDAAVPPFPEPDAG
jgi:hypothetical protein